MKKILLFAFFNLFSAFSFIVFILEFSKHCEIAFLIPALLCFLISFVYDKKRYYIELNDENKENEKIKSYIDDIRCLISNIHIDNNKMRLSYMLSNELNKFFVGINIFKVSDLSNLTNDNITEMYKSSYAKTYRLVFDKLKYSLSEALRKDFFDILHHRSTFPNKKNFVKLFIN